MKQHFPDIFTLYLYQSKTEKNSNKNMKGQPWGFKDEDKAYWDQWSADRRPDRSGRRRVVPVKGVYVALLWAAPPLSGSQPNLYGL